MNLRLWNRLRFWWAWRRIKKDNAAVQRLADLGHVLRCRLAHDSWEPFDCLLELREGYVNEKQQGRLIAAWFESLLEPGVYELELELTEEEKEKVKDPHNLFLRVASIRV